MDCFLGGKRKTCEEKKKKGKVLPDKTLEVNRRPTVKEKENPIGGKEKAPGKKNI